MRRIKRIGAVLLIAVLCSLFGSVPAQATTSKQVLVIGDSITGGASNYIGFYMGASDGSVQTTFRTVGGFAICDLLPGNGGPWTYNSLFAEKRYDAVVMAFSGNAMTKCMGGRTGQAVIDKYRADAHAVMQTAQQYAVPDVVWVKPPAAQSAELDYVRSGVGKVYGYLPNTFPTARVIDAGPGLEYNGKFILWDKCASWDYNHGVDGCDAWGNIRIGDNDGVHLYCRVRQPAYYGVVPPCDVYSAGNNRYGMNLSATRKFIGL